MNINIQLGLRRHVRVCLLFICIILDAHIPIPNTSHVKFIPLRTLLSSLGPLSTNHSLEVRLLQNRLAANVLRVSVLALVPQPIVTKHFLLPLAPSHSASSPSLLLCRVSVSLSMCTQIRTHFQHIHVRLILTTPTHIQTTMQMHA